jgi:hypothetical protein
VLLIEESAASARASFINPRHAADGSVCALADPLRVVPVATGVSEWPDALRALRTSRFRAIDREVDDDDR